MTGQVFLNFENIATFIDTHTLFVWDAGTKQFIVYKRVIGLVNCYIRWIIFITFLINFD